MGYWPSCFSALPGQPSFCYTMKMFHGGEWDANADFVYYHSGGVSIDFRTLQLACWIIPWTDSDSALLRQ